MRFQVGHPLQTRMPLLTAGWIITTRTAASGTWQSCLPMNFTITSPHMGTPPVCCRSGSNENVLDWGCTLETKQWTQEYRAGGLHLLPGFYALLLQHLLHKAPHCVCSFVLLLPGGVGICPQGKSGIIVAQHTGYRLDVHAVLKDQHSERVPKLVEAKNGRSS